MALAAGVFGPHSNILGHEGVGYIAKLGAAVDSTIFQVGDRVAIAWVRDICGSCVYCLSPGGETRCIQQYNSGRKWEGTFSEYAIVPSRYVIQIPKDIDVDDKVITPILCGGVTAYKALKISHVTPGKWIAISGGGGGVGALGIQFARAMGYRVIAIDVGPEKEQYCINCGAEAYFNALDNKDLPTEIENLTNGEGASCVLACAGNSKAYDLSFKILGPFGVLVCVGIPAPNQTIHFHPLLCIDKDVRIIGSAVGTRQDIIEALRFVQRGLVRPSIEPIVLEELSGVIHTFDKVSL